MPDAAAGRSTDSAASTGTIDLRVVWSATDDVAPHRNVELLHWEVPANERYQRHVTNDQGRLLLEGLQPGRMILEVDLGGRSSVTLAAGETREVTLEIPQGFQLEGQVVDVDGNAVPDASIWLSEPANYTNGFEVTKTNAAGLFVIPSVHGSRYIGARAPGHGPSFCLDLDDARELGADPMAPLWIQIELSARGGSMAGVVFQPDGTQAASVRVQVQGRCPPAKRLESGRVLNTVPPVELRTDENGEFDVFGLWPGDATLTVSAPNMARHSEAVPIANRENTQVIVHLNNSPLIHGTVADADGERLEGVRITLQEEYSPERPTATTDAQGHYELVGVPVGTLDLVASRKDLGEDRQRVVAEAGAKAQRDFVLDPGLVLRGRLVDGDDQPLEGFTINLHNRSNRFWKQARTSADGSFAILNCPSEPLELNVKRDALDFTPLLLRHELRVAEIDELLLVYSEAEHAPGGLHVRILDHAGAPALGHVVPWLEGQDSASIYEIDVNTGDVDVHPLIPGRYRVMFDLENMPSVFLGEHDVHPGQTTELGLVHLEQPGHLEFDLVGEASFDGFTLLARGSSGEFDQYLMHWELEHVQERKLLLPGEYQIRATGNGVAMRMIEFGIQSNQTTFVELSAESGIATVLRFFLPPGDERPNSCVATLTGPSGELTLSGSVRDDPPELRFFPVNLPPGDYEVTVTTDAGHRGTEEFRVESGEQRLVVEGDAR